MNCMKCGREMDEEQAFCLDCRMEMEKYPVRPGTVVLLPPPEDVPARRTGSRYRPAPSTDEVIASLTRRVRYLSAALAAVLLILAGLCFYTVHLLADQPQTLPGQNYSSVSAATTVPTEG